MHLNYIVDGRQHETRASVIPPSGYINYPMFWVELAVGADVLNLGTRDPEQLSATLRELADKLDAQAATYTAQTVAEQAA